MIGPHQATDSSKVVRTVDGRVVRGTRKGQEPLAGQWVVLHRVGPDAASPLDSMRTSANGRYHMRYQISGDSSALYFVSTKFGAVAYFTSPLREPVVRGDDATITVFDTTSGPVAIQLGGRHIIIGMPQANGRRPVGEVYDLKNDSTVTLIPRDSTGPVWRAGVPAAAVSFQLNPSGDLARGSVTQRGTTVELFVPLSPGIRQMAFTYELPVSAFPLSIPIERPTGVLELLVQEPTARVKGAALREMAPVNADGRMFRRFLGQDVAANTVVTVDAPRLVGPERQKVYIGVGLVVLAAMACALIFAGRRTSPSRTHSRIAAQPTRAQTVLRDIAALDAEYERAPVPEDSDARFVYESKRSALKAELAAAMASERPT
ncbi:MAG: hypothetical protein ABJF01_10550 [bacterium]